MMSTIARLHAARWPLVGGFFLLIFVLHQLYTSSLATHVNGIFSSGAPHDGAQYSNAIANTVPGLTTKDPSEPALPSWRESATNHTPIPYNPYPEYNSRQWKDIWRGTHMPCMGPRGTFVNDNPDDMIMGYQRQLDAPAPIIGSYEETGLDSKFCFERSSRMKPYGFVDQTIEPEESEEEEMYSWEEPKKPAEKKPDIWKEVRWGALQSECIAKNSGRYEPRDEPMKERFSWPTARDVDEVDSVLINSSDDTSEDLFESAGKSLKSSRRWGRGSGKEYKKKSALVLRTYDGLDWTPAVVRHIRSYIMELSLHSGGEYEIIIMSEVKDLEKHIFDYEESYRKALWQAVPPEFREMTILFNRHLLEKWYPLAGKHPEEGSQTHYMHQPMQLLSLLRPDIEFFWQAELDQRYTGHHYQLFEKARQWAAAEPRRLLWERNARYYFPSVHGTWGQYNAWIAEQTPDGGVWGPVHTEGIKPCGPTPPTSKPEDDAYEWGVGEEADFLILAPVFDVTNTSKNDFLFKNHRLQYPDGPETPAYATATVPLTRFSKRLLRAMHHGQVTQGFDMMPEMMPESSALHHGLKLVSFPLPVYVDRAIPASVIERAFSKNKGETMLNHPYDHENVLTWRRMTYWHSMDGEVNYQMELWARWTGKETDEVEAEQERLCLPQMLIHPVKDV